MYRIIFLIFTSLFAITDIKFDGNVESDEWSDADKHTVDFEISPSYNNDAEHLTEAFITHDEKYIYVAFKAYGNKEYIRANIRSRDGIAWQNDHVVVGIDTYGDGRYYIGFGVNPLGSIYDFKATGFNDDPDRNYNIEFDAYANLTDYGYQAEIRIPISSLNFPETLNQKWKVAFYRKLYNKDIESRYLSHKLIEGAGCFICQSEKFYELSGIEKKTKKRLIPSITANSAEQGAEDNVLKSGEINGDFGIGGEYEFGGNTFEFTYNPDFSQVEADESQIDINSTTALRLQERRIFFNEGKDFLSSGLSTVYTRAINDPEYALKIYNRGDTHSYFFLDAQDQNTPIIIPGLQRSYSGLLGQSQANIFSYNYNIDNGQSVGFLATNRAYEGGGNGLLYSMNGSFILDDKYSLRFELAKSDTEEPISDVISTDDETDDYTYKLDGEKFGGYAGIFGLRRSTKNWTTNYAFATKSPEFRTDLGFTTENNWIQHSLDQVYRYRSEGFVREANFTFRKNILQTYDDVILDHKTSLRGRAELNNQINFNLSWDNSHKASFEGTIFKDIRDYNFGLGYNPSERFYTRLNYSWGDSIARNLDQPIIGERKNYSIYFSYSWTDKFRTQYNYRKNSLTDNSTGEEIFSGYLTSIKGIYQFNKDSFFRIVREYNDFNNDSYTQALFQWQPNSATIFYFGGTLNQKDIEGTWEREGSQIYMKLQYLFNFD